MGAPISPPKNEIVVLSTWIREQMKRKNVSLKELSIATNIPKSTLHGWAYGRMDTTYEKLTKVLAALGC